jgi:hypothetical protein
MFDCIVCAKSFKRLSQLRSHFASLVHRQKVNSLDALPSSNITQPNPGVKPSN